MEAISVDTDFQWILSTLSFGFNSSKGAKMLRTWILFFLPSIMMANHKEPYMENIRSTIPTTFTGYPPTYTKSPTNHAEKSVNETSLNVLKSRRPPYKLILNEIPVNKPIIKPPIKPVERKTKQQEYYMNIPVYVANKLNFNKRTKNEDFLNDYSKLLQKSGSPVFTEKPLHELVNAEAFLKHNRPKPFYEDLKFPVSDEKPINKEVNEEALLPNENNSPKQLYENLLLPTSTEQPSSKVEKDQAFEITDINEIPKQINEDVEDLPLPTSTEKPKDEPIDEEEILQTNRPFHDNLQLPVTDVTPVQKRVVEQAFVPHKRPNSFYEYKKVNNPKSFNHFPLPLFTERPATNQNRDQYLPQFPIITKNPIDEDVFSYDAPVNVYKSQLPVFMENPVQDDSHARKDRLIKQKMVSLIFSTRKDLEKQTQNIRSIHNNFKSGTMYKIGYLISLINKMNRRLSKLYTSVQSNKHKWDTLKMLETYETVKSNSELVRDMVKLMRAFLRVKRKSIQKPITKEPSERNSIAPDLGISWSYYDDSLS